MRHTPSVFGAETIGFTACCGPSRVCRVVRVEAWLGACPTPCMPRGPPPAAARAAGLEKQVKFSISMDFRDTR